MAKPQIYSMKWNNYQNHIGSIFVKLLESETMVDLTLCAEGGKISCHRLILSACSTYFKEVLSEVNSSHAVVILSGISAEDVRAIIEFVYKGELNVNADKFPSVLKAAEVLKISGLMEVNSYIPMLQVEDMESVNCDGFPSEVSEIVEAEELHQVKEEVLDPEDGTMTLENTLQLISESNCSDNNDTTFTIVADASEVEADFSFHIPESEIKPKRKREFTKKEYSEEELSAAIEDLMKGRSLIETANLHNIPRSTLYSRARSFGITPGLNRHDYSEQSLTSAVETVKSGASLQAASELYRIPKTVLWRRVQKDVGCYALSRRARLRQRYLPHVKEAAIRALEKGEKMNKVASLYKIPKTTLFREKSRLVEEGKLPTSCLNRRAPNNDRFKQVRLTQAVAACKEGRMSQSTASSTFKVSKTTIWRRLQQSGDKDPNLIKPKTDTVEIDSDFQEVTEIPFTYSDERESYPLIVLRPSSELTNDITYQPTDDMVMLPENFEDIGEVIEIQETPSYSEEVVLTEENEVTL